ncbi:interleukin-18 receptor accessory protein-like [Anneissia japonica]|uniref:interleukin-18 receptor accessory protein-like n=1 Tax=Anneissia japonica TaxID=1529436 RepID=UPI0014258134|nr:interleukin-18 receptor accessory protein-like [Anneissia japonica]
MSWERDGRRLPTNISRIHADYSPMPLRIVYFINNMTDAHNGEYVCTVNETLVQRVNVIAIGMPEPFIVPPLNHSVVEGQNVSLTCKVKASAGTVKWTRYDQDLNNFTALHNTNKTHVLFDEMARVSTLTIVMAELSDETSYRCYVGHTFQRGDLNFVEAYITVIVQPLGDYPVIEETANDDVFSVLEDDLISVTCSVYDVKPAPELMWTLGGNMIDEKYQTIEVAEEDRRFTIKNSLKLQAHSRDNSKEMTCIAKSDFFSSAKQSIQLNVSYAPKIYIEPDSINILEGDKLTVNCNGSSNPTHITYRWECSKLNGDVIHQVGQTFSVHKVTSDFDQSSLRCNASNSIGTSQVVLKAINISGTGPQLEIILPVTAMFLLFGSVTVIVLVYLRKKRTTIPHITLEQQKEFDVFISYKGGTDEEIFVIRILVPKLEEFGYKVCVHYKHFVGGKTIIENINESISNSHMTIIVLSPAFVESVWCKFEFQSASTQMPNFENTVIPVMFDDVTHLANLDKTLQDLLKRVNYITWPRNCENDDANERQFWKLLRKALRPTVNPRL